jgi:hypothetical protein
MSARMLWGLWGARSCSSVGVSIPRRVSNASARSPWTRDGERSRLLWLADGTGDCDGELVLFHTDDAVLSGFRRLARSPALAAAEMPAKTSGRMISRPDIVGLVFPFLIRAVVVSQWYAGLGKRRREWVGSSNLTKGNDGARVSISHTENVPMADGFGAIIEMQPRVVRTVPTYHTWLCLCSSTIPRHEYVSERLSQRLMIISLPLPFALVSSSTISTHIKAAE